MGTAVRTTLVGIIGSVLAIGLLVFAWNLYSLTNKPLLHTTTDNAIIISLDKSATAYQFANLLKQKKLISSTKLFVYLIRAKGLAHRLKAGVYQILPDESASHLLDRVVAGDVITQNFSIIAGTTQQKVAHDLMQAPYLTYHPEDWDTIKGSYANAEGLLLADTYQYQGGSSSLSVLTHAHTNLMQYLDNVWAHRDANLPYSTAYELLTAASIIEKETAIPAERKLISGVLINRLNKKMPLQMDPTVIYGLGSEYKGKLSHRDLQVASPYNSYLFRGLPPTPIAMIGKEAIDAAAHPELSHYLYYVAKGDGSHQFSETYEQQRRAIEQYQRKDS